MKSLRFAVVGDPIAHSKSPAMHSAAFAALGLPHTYEAIHATASELPAVVQRLRDGEFAGLNVTVPHKRAVLSLVDAIDPLVSIVGAANTLVLEGSRLLAANTDMDAVAAEIKAFGVRSPIDHALVIGAGGAARACIVGLSRHLGVKKITLRSRRSSDDLAREMETKLGVVVTVEPLSPSDRESTFDCIIQATSAGMSPADPGDLVADAIAWDRVRDDAVALDVITLTETPFLRAARARGLRTRNGLGMLARQGALAFEMWLKVAPPLDVMLETITSA